MPLSPSALTAGQARRMARCGMPVVHHRLSGARYRTSFRCGVRWCPDCSWSHQLRVHSCIAQSVGALTIDDDGLYVRTPGRRVWMVTLTQPAPRGLSEHRLERALELQRRLWRDATGRLRWWEARAGRGDVDAAERLQPPRLSNGTPHPEYASTWDEELGDWPYPELGVDGYVWALELTTGQAADRWHLHRHVIVPTLAMAQRVNAAWQGAVATLQIPGHGWARTSIDECSGYYASWYVAGYVAGKCETDEIPERLHLRYRRVMSGCHRYDAGGANRPLGIAPDPSEDPVVAVEIPGYSQRAADRIWPAAEFFSGEAACWSPRTSVELGDDWRPVVDVQAVLEDAVAEAELRRGPLGKHPEARAP